MSTGIMLSKKLTHFLHDAVDGYKSCPAQLQYMINVSTNFQHNQSKTVRVCETKLPVSCKQTDTGRAYRQADSSIPPKKNTFV